MGAGASTNVKEELTKATEEDLKKAVAELTPEAKKKLLAALEEKNLEAEEKSDPFAFTSGLKDCCSTNPEIYKVVAEIPNARLVEMTCPPGGEDKPHEHPAHSMFFIKGGKLSITDIKDGKNGEPHEVEIPDGAPPIFPAGAHQVKNVGEAEVKVLFVEAYPTCKPCGDVKEMITPFKVKPDCYKILAENDDVRAHVTCETARHIIFDQAIRKRLAADSLPSVPPLSPPLRVLFRGRHSGSREWSQWSRGPWTACTTTRTT